MSENRGAFYIPAEDKTDTADFVVPGDLTGETQRGNENPSQESYHVDNRQSQHAKQYYVKVVNGWDIDLDVGVEGSSFDDEDMTDAVTDMSVEALNNGQTTAFERDTGHSYLQVVFQNLTAAPSSGTLKVVIQDRFR